MITDAKIVVLKAKVECFRQALIEICAAFEVHDECHAVSGDNDHVYATDMYEIAVTALEAGYGSR